MLDAKLSDYAVKKRAQDPRPNILFIFTDQQTASAMSCAGNPYVKTPWMDRLAAQGVRFTRSYCADPICGPSRSALITGRMPHETGVIFNDDAPCAQIPNIGELMRQAGYDTTWVGKWHLPESFDRSPSIRGFRNVPVLEGMDWPALSHGDMTDCFFAGEAYKRLRWELVKCDSPWMLTVSVHNPHDICLHGMEKETPPHLNAEHYPPLPPNFEIPEDEAEILKECRSEGHSGQEMPYTKDWDETRWRAYLDAYYRMVQTVDDSIGLILRGLEQSGMRDQTLIVFTSDHGEGMAAHRWVCVRTISSSRW